MNGWEFVSTLIGKILSWPVAMVAIVLILRNPLRNLLPRLNEAEGFGLKATFQELAEAVDHIELEADLQLDRRGENTGVESDSAEDALDDDSRALRMRSAFQEARIDPKRSIRNAREQLRARVRLWIRRKDDELRKFVIESGKDWQYRIERSFEDELDRFQYLRYITTDLKVSILNADSLGESLNSRFRRPGESQALSYLSLINRIERLLDYEVKHMLARVDDQDE